ncbi:MAG TPA: hypothetical protein PLA54_01245 [Spirochaetota bacterium]|nr:hypothetical protein [Spirochaetota bacterium]HQE57796.1 hypothetical protein [Spirochaetota bacterium]
MILENTRLKFFHAEKIFIVLFIVFLQLTDSLNAQVLHSQEMNLTTSTDVELKASYSHEITVPFLNSPNVLFENNEISFDFSAFLSPISAGLEVETLFRPIALLEFSTGIEIGSGWNSRFVRGLAINEPSGSYDNYFNNKTLKGIVHKEKAGAAFQFDVGAVIPGEWTHVVFRSYHQYYYKAFTAASKNESWLWEADDGENRNGTHYYIQNVLGYKMPLMMEFFGLMIEAERSYYDTANGDPSGENIWNYTASCIMGFRSGENTKFNLITQFRSVRNYTEETEEYDYYRSRVIDPDKSRKWEFYRIILNMTYEF